MASNVACVFLALAGLSLVTARRAASPQLGAIVDEVSLAAERRSSASGNPLKTVSRQVFNKDGMNDNTTGIGKTIGAGKCGETVRVTSAHDKDAHCPSACPFYAQDKTDHLFCTFVCVEASQCAVQNPNKPIADEKLGACRAPMVNHCREYNLDGTDTCKKCQSLYALGEDGLCHYQYFFLLYILLVLFVVIVVFLVVWVVDMIIRPVTNEVGLKIGHDFRSTQKLRQPKQENGGRNLWCLSSNLMHQNIAGPGMMLHFNFQSAVIVWAFVVALLWCSFAIFVDGDLFILGTRKFGTPRENCILVAWGYETQQRLMWTKIMFLAIVYTLSFTMALLFGVRQLRLFQLFDFDNKTHKDFVALIDGLPCLKGSEKVEDEISKVVEKATSQKVVGVSVCWNFKEDEEEVMKYLDNSLDKREKQMTKSDDDPVPNFDTSDLNPVRKQLYGLESALFGPEEKDEARPDAELDAEFETKLKEMTSSRYAFAVFETEEARDLAIQAVAENGFTYEDQAVTLKANDCEPRTVQWKNFDNSDLPHFLRRLGIGFFFIFLGLVFWTVVFYAPYAWSVMNFNYDNGQEPGFIYGLSFSLIVCVGNVIMYEICNRVSDYVGFKFSDEREACYTVLYCIACMFNVLMDFVTTYYTALNVMKGLGFRTYVGEKLENIDEFHEQFDTYAMQRSLAQNTYAYAFPSTFLIPFLIEPFATIYLPWQLGVWVVRSHPEILGRDAEALLSPAPMDMGRYADIILDMILGILIFYFPGGYTHSLFFAMALCHIYIYLFDHWKVLRGIPAVAYASMDIDWCAQAMMAPCCGLMLSCMVFKGNCQDYGYCISGGKLIEVTTLVFCLHCVVHLSLLKYLVPLFGRDQPENEKLKDITYKQLASEYPCSFFSANPIHCLRSRLIYTHKPPCSFFEIGKAHLMDTNEAIGCYFKAEKIAGDEDDEFTLSGARALVKSLTKSLSTDSPST